MESFGAESNSGGPRLQALAQMRLLLMAWMAASAFVASEAAAQDHDHEDQGWGIGLELGVDKEFVPDWARAARIQAIELGAHTEIDWGFGSRTPREYGIEIASGPVFILREGVTFGVELAIAQHEERIDEDLSVLTWQGGVGMSLVGERDASWSQFSLAANGLWGDGRHTYGIDFGAVYRKLHLDFGFRFDDFEGDGHGHDGVSFGAGFEVVDDTVVGARFTVPYEWDEPKTIFLTVDIESPFVEDPPVINRADPAVAELSDIQVRDRFDNVVTSRVDLFRWQLESDVEVEEVREVEGEGRFDKEVVLLDVNSGRRFRFKIIHMKAVADLSLSELFEESEVRFEYVLPDGDEEDPKEFFNYKDLFEEIQGDL